MRKYQGIYTWFIVILLNHLLACHDGISSLSEGVEKCCTIIKNNEGDEAAQFCQQLKSLVEHGDFEEEDSDIYSDDQFSVSYLVDHCADDGFKLSDFVAFRSQIETLSNTNISNTDTTYSDLDGIENSYFHRSEYQSYDGKSWWCGIDELQGYRDGWLQFLQSESINLDYESGHILSVMMQWNIEDHNNGSYETIEDCSNGWDAFNVRISNDQGETWRLLRSPEEDYHFTYGYGFLYNDSSYDCGKSQSHLAAGWGGDSYGWRELQFDLGDYLGDSVIIQFAFGSDPMTSTVSNSNLNGVFIDNIMLINNLFGDVIILDDADENIIMRPLTPTMTSSFRKEWRSCNIYDDNSHICIAHTEDQSWCEALNGIDKETSCPSEAIGSCVNINNAEEFGSDSNNEFMIFYYGEASDNYGEMCIEVLNGEYTSY